MRSARLASCCEATVMACDRRTDGDNCGHLADDTWDKPEKKWPDRCSEYKLVMMSDGRYVEMAS